MAEAKKGDKKGEAPALAPIIIKKVMGEEAGAHGGAWKIALADMMTAMMAFFLLMWLLGATTEVQRKSIADYFKPTPKSMVQMSQMAGSNGVLGGRSFLDPEGMPAAASQTSLLDLTPPSDPEKGPEKGAGAEPDDKQGKGPDAGDKDGKGSDAGDKQGKGPSTAEQDQKNFDALEKEITDKLKENSALASLAGQVRFVRASEGLRIEVIDKADFSMFSLGTSRLLPRAQALVDEVARAVAAMPNKVVVRGNTDSLPFANKDKRTNFALSAERAETTRQALEKRGVSPERFAGIEGAADTDPFVPNDPADPRNRRISITVKFR
ncbi:MAG: motB [Hyphomicrobiales bacterium]|nr:motB [Hyphomicrobiales bacterium]